MKYKTLLFSSLSTPQFLQQSQLPIIKIGCTYTNIHMCTYGLFFFYINNIIVYPFLDTQYILEIFHNGTYRLASFFFNNWQKNLLYGCAII